MGFFDRFKQKGGNLEVPPAPEKAPVPFGPTVVEIARVIAGGDEAVLGEITACTADPRGWFAEHQDLYEERGIDSPGDLDQVQWLGLVDILETHGWVCERDWKDELEDFLFFLERLKGCQALQLPLDPAWFTPEGDIPLWCSILTQKWEAQGARVAAIGIDSDSYVLFPVSPAQFVRLQQLAGEIGQCIDYIEQL